MSISATTHLNFRGDARQALDFYQSVFGGQIMAATYSQVGAPQDSATSQRAVFSPVDSDSPDADHLAFGMLATDSGLRLAAYDVLRASGGSAAGGLAGSDLAGAAPRADGPLGHTESSFVLLNSETTEEARASWEGLADGGVIIQDLAPADWAPVYGMLTDRFGVTWIFGIAPAS